MIKPHFSFTGSRHQRIFNNENPSSAPSASNSADRLSGVFEMPPANLSAVLWPVITSWKLLGYMASETLRVVPPVINATRWGVGKVLGGAKDVADTTAAVTIGGVQDVVIGAPLMATKNAFNAVVNSKDLAITGIVSTAATAVEAPKVAFGAVADVVNGTRNALGLNQIWNFTLGRLPGLKVADKAKTDNTANWIKERWGRFGGKAKDVSLDIAKAGISVADAYGNWLQRIGNSGVVRKVRDLAGGSSGNGAPVSNFLFHRNDAAAAA